jgi:hypothetical protein
MLLTNIVLVIAVILMIAIAIGLSRDGSGKPDSRGRRQQVRIIDADKKSDDDR